jgi:hypothetical protein
MADRGRAAWGERRDVVLRRSEPRRVQCGASRRLVHHCRVGRRRAVWTLCPSWCLGLLGLVDRYACLSWHWPDSIWSAFGSWLFARAFPALPLKTYGTRAAAHVCFRRDPFFLSEKLCACTVARAISWLTPPLVSMPAGQYVPSLISWWKRLVVSKTPSTFLLNSCGN